MQIFEYPKRETWKELLARPVLDRTFLSRTVANIVADVRDNGDVALKHCAKFFDKVELDEFAVNEKEFAAADSLVSDELKGAIAVARTNIEKFHVACMSDQKPVIETMPGVRCWQRTVGIQRVGLYVPAGSAPLFSTVLMLAVPAKLAGCEQVVLCSPPNERGEVHPAILYTARLCGVTQVFKTGGAQAIAAMAYGTETVPAVDKIFGPGNQFVTEAKQQVTGTVAIDMPAGPSEVAVLADETAIPEFVAADLLSQAEHGPDSQVLLVTDNRGLMDSVIEQVLEQLESLPRRETALAALANSKFLLVHNIATGVDLINEYAPEHLIAATRDADAVAETIKNAGSVFIGNYSCESAGDYASGTNHTLPTGGFARSFSGVSIESFQKKITFQKLSREGLIALGPTIEVMARAEELTAHERAVSIRLREIRSRGDV